MTDQARLDRLEDRVACHERDLARTVRIIALRQRGHATKKEIAELDAIADRYPRYPAPPPPTDD